jgi:enoyl-CoA hydratase/carnithine racemase
MLPPSLAFTRDGDVGILELNRPAKRNALDDETVRGLERFAAAPPAGVGALVLCAAGDHFSAGLDLADVSQRDLAASIAHSRLWHRAFEAPASIGYFTEALVASAAATDAEAQRRVQAFLDKRAAKVTRA